MELFHRPAASKKLPRDSRGKLSVLPTRHADWVAVVSLGLAAVGYAAYAGELKFREVAGAVAAAESQRQGREVLVVEAATDLLREFEDRAAPAGASPAATSSSAAR